MVKVLWFVLDQLPELFHLNFLPEFLPEILRLPQAAKKFFTGGKVEGGTGYEERSLRGKIQLSVGRRNQVESISLILETVSSDEVPLIDILDDFAFAHLYR